MKKILGTVLSFGLVWWGSSATKAMEIRWMDSSLTPAGNTAMENYTMPQFSQGLMAVTTEVGGEIRYGYVNTQGEMAISPYYLDAGVFSQGIAPVKVLVSQEEADENLKGFLGDGWTGTQGGEGMVERYGYINQYGHVVIPPCFLQAYDFHEGLAAVEVTPGIWGYMNPWGVKAFEALFHWAGDFRGNFAVVSSQGKYGVISQYGAYVLQPWYDSIAGGDGVFFVYEQGGFGLMNDSGNWISTQRYAQGGYFSQGLALVEDNGRWGYVNGVGAMAISPVYTEAYHFQEGLAWVQTEEGYGYIDCNGRMDSVVLTEDYSQLSSFSQGYARVKQGVYYGFIDKTGSEVVPVVYRDAIPVSEGLGLVYNGTAWGIFSTEHNCSVWAEDFVKEAEERDLLPTALVGIDLNQPLNRTEFVALVLALYESMAGDYGHSAEEIFAVPSPWANPFVDTQDEGVRRAYALGIASGKSPDYFAAYESIEREQAAAMLLAMYEVMTGVTVSPSASHGFTDGAEISAWAERAVAYFSEKKVIAGVGEGWFDPRSPISGQEALVMVLNMGNL